MTTTQFQPDWSISPGDFLTEVLESKDVRQSELADRTGLTTKHINQIVKNKASISGDVAVLFERALDVPARVWTAAEADWDAHIGEQRAKEALSGYRGWTNLFDLETLLRYNIVRRSDSLDTRTEKLLRFFKVASPDAFRQSWVEPRVSFRRSQSFTVQEENTALWLRLVERSAESVPVEPFSPRRLRKTAKDLRSMTTLPLVDGFLAAREALKEAGVVLTFVQEVPQTRMLAATWWLSSDRPVIGITARQRRPDTFWFTLLHEVGHIVLHPRRKTFLDLPAQKREHSQEEKEADSFAIDTLFPGDALERIAQAEDRTDLIRLAAKFGVGVACVAGQYAFRHHAYPAMSALRGTIGDDDITAMECLSQVG